jgi:hypothetical protein
MEYFFLLDTNSRVQIVSNISRFCRIRIWIQIEENSRNQFRIHPFDIILKSIRNTDIHINTFSKYEYR